MDSGKVVEEGNTKNLAKNGYYANLLKAQLHKEIFNFYN